MTGEPRLAGSLRGRKKSRMRWLMGARPGMPVILSLRDYDTPQSCHATANDLPRLHEMTT